MSWRQEVLTLRGWIVTILHDLMLGGMLVIFLFFAQQFFGVSIGIYLPDIYGPQITKHVK